MKISIIIPTYNESENIGKLVSVLDNILKDLNHEIIIVDDNSSDKTYGIVEELAKKHNNIRLIRRINKKGLASAVVDGFKDQKAMFLLLWMRTFSTLLN